MNAATNTLSAPNAANDVSAPESTRVLKRAIESLIEAGVSFTSARGLVLAEFEEYFFARMLELHGGNVSRAAAAAGISRRYYYMRRAR